MNQTPSWRFRTIEEDQKHVEPTHREHLAPGGAVEPLARESIQNSLDVTLPDRPTKMIFALGEADPTAAKVFFDGLRPHLEAITGSLPEGLPNAEEPVRFLSIEDFNTTGLEGDPDPANRKRINSDGTKNHFFRFWHCVGQSSGDFKRRGSWGVGKVVFSNASRIRTFFGLTLRANDPSPLLMGEAGLTIHALPSSDSVYDWYGYYASHEQRRSDHFVPLPAQNSPTVSDFAQVFSISRTEPGLSIVVPYVREEVQLDALARAVIDQYFLPILAGKLEVIVRGNGDEVVITQATIDAAVGKVSWPRGGSTQEEMIALLQVARWQIALPLDQHVTLKQIGGDGSYLLDAGMFPETTLSQLSDDYEVGKRIAIRVPIDVRPKQGAPTTEEIRIVLERDDSLRLSNVPHLRSGINISKMREQGGPGVRGLLVVGVDSESQGDLEKLLQASEGPAHMNWEQRGEGYDKARSLYDDAYKVIVFMRHLARSVVVLLAAPSDTHDTETLAKFFPDYEDGTDVKRLRNKRKLAPPPPIGTIAGVVRALMFSAGGLRAIDSASVTLTTPDLPSNSTSTDANGSFSFPIFWGLNTR